MKVDKKFWINFSNLKIPPVLRSTPDRAENPPPPPPEGSSEARYKKEDEFKHRESTVPDYLIEQANNEGQNRRANTKRKKIVAQKEPNVIMDKQKYSPQPKSLCPSRHPPGRE